MGRIPMRDLGERGLVSITDLIEYRAVLLRGDKGNGQTLRAEAPGAAHLRNSHEQFRITSSLEAGLDPNTYCS